MKKLTPLLAIIGLLMLVAPSCKKESNISTFSATDFPLKLGNSWTYKVTDSINNTISFQTFSITGVTTTGDTTKYLTIETINDTAITVGSFFVTQNNVWFQPVAVNFRPFDYLYLATPFKYPDSWQNTEAYINYSVETGPGDYAVQGQTYHNVFGLLANDQGNISDFALTLRYKIATGIGIVYEKTSAYGFVGPMNRSTYELISYHLN